MLYRLKNEFTKIEETEGVLENKSIHTPVEIVMTDGAPEKDTGLDLQPKEKIPFKVKGGKSVYARCTNFEHMGANLAVVNFNMPASEGTGAGTKEEKVLWEGDVSTETLIHLSESLKHFRELNFVVTRVGGVDYINQKMYVSDFELYNMFITGYSRNQNEYIRFSCDNSDSNYKTIKIAACMNMVTKKIIGVN